MIRTARFVNFKSLADVTLELGRFTVLVGANGAGKSSVLRALVLPSEEEAGETVRRCWSDPTTALLVHLGSDEIGHRFQVEPVPGWDSTVSRRSLGFSYTGSISSRALTLMAQFGAVYLHPEASMLGRTSVAAPNPRLGPAGENLASVLAAMAGFDSDAFRLISDKLGRVVPGARRVRVVTTQVVVTETQVHVLNGQEVRVPQSHEEPGHRLEVQFDDDRWVPGELLSEGTLVALGLLTALHLPDARRILLLDDIDRGLHIEAQTRLMEILRELLASDPELQIVATTHSPHLVNLCDAKEVVVLALDEHRHTVAKRLDQHPDYDKWKYGTQTGELWAALGSHWVAEPGA